MQLLYIFFYYYDLSFGFDAKINYAIHIISFKMLKIKQ